MMMQTTRGIGDNSAVAPGIRVTVRLFNSLAAYGGDTPGATELDLPAGACVGDVVRRFGVPADRIYLVLVNGRDVTRTLGGPVNLDRQIEDGDVVALSGPVPFSWGYGAPVV